MAEEHIYALRLKGGGVHIMQLFPVNGKVADIADEVKRLPYAADIKSWDRIRREDIPSDRTFRDAWGHDLKVDMGKAREIAKDRLRQARAPRMAALDVEYQRADEVGDNARKKAVAAQKQALRDWTSRKEITTAASPDELRLAAAAICASEG